MEIVQDFLQAYKYFIYTILLILVSAIVIKNYWEEIKFWWVCTWYSFPLIGKIAKLSKDTKSMENNGWFSSESTLCSDFHTFYDKFDKDAEHYDRCKSYLSKVDELGRKPFPSLMWIIIFVLVILEALGFAYVLAGFTIPGASESVQQYGAFGIAIIISIILVGFTHWTGYEIYKNSLIKKIRVYFGNDRRDDKRNLERDATITLETNEIDDKERNYSQILNRINTNATVTPTWIISIITGIFIIVIAIGATYVRGQVLEKQLNEEVSNVQTNVYSPYPTELTQSQESVDKKAVDERIGNDRKGGWATFIVLAVLFVFIQLMGILFGFKWGFIGKESMTAYLDSHNFRTKQDFINYFKKEKDSIAKIAQQKLQLLQQKMYQNGSMTSTSSKEMELLKNKENRTFLKYVIVQHQESAQYDKEKNSIDLSVEKQEFKTQQNINENIVLEEKNKTNKLFCIECGTEVLENSKFCGNCGKAIEVKPKVPTCPKCNTVYEESVKFCSNDGSKLELV
ncbi:MAG: zinc ribbon domain-containing protein [Arcobacter sp.]|jgi:hypothetical protein|uniref:zinc ribbon domain-containing protein n=1 Tax=Arcobacter sp. TaxID=1872629 RepID=UPI00258B1FC7|nr:zinc ribbon domain-containing protein [Arcobacter sp.]MDD3009149.1 zinc ribbon domain-containing protein [Arcobacter sp.]MDX9815131.1 zinc ribbon domain-containing protein [Sulfurimonadaceae bacterium]MDY3203927.1 zinc ribbon domain-containing protein [Arcobacter sp.]